MKPLWVPLMSESFHNPCRSVGWIIETARPGLQWARL